MTPYYEDEHVTLWHGDALAVLSALPSASVDSCVTSPPYFGLRDYGVDGQYGLEASPVAYVEQLVAVFGEVRRVLADDGTLWLNMGDSYSGSWGAQGRSSKETHAGKHAGVVEAGVYPTNHRGQTAMPPAKNMLGMPWRLALALQADGWILRNDIIWAKRNAMPESVTDRLANRHEHVFLLTKSPSYWFGLDDIREPHSEATLNRAAPGRAAPGKSRREGHGVPPGNRPHTARLDQINHPNGRNPGDVWTLPTQPFPDAHFAVMPSALAERCILAGCKPGGVALDPFSGSGTTGLAAAQHGRRYVGIDLNPAYLDLSLRTRLGQTALLDGGVA